MSLEDQFETISLNDDDEKVAQPMYISSREFVLKTLGDEKSIIKPRIDPEVTIHIKNSASFSEIYEGTCSYEKDGRIFYIPVILKVFPSSSNKIKQEYVHRAKCFVEDLKSLEYENKVYSRITKDILLKDKSPCFLYYIQNVKSNKKIERIPKQNLNVNISETVYFGEDLYNKCKLIYESDILEICFSIVEKATNLLSFSPSPSPSLSPSENSDFYKNTTLHDLIKIKPINNPINKQDYRCIVAQLLIALLCLDNEGITHNDLHTRNIFISEFKTPKQFSYTVNGLTFNITTKYVPFIFDFDLAFSYKDGINPRIKMDEDRLATYGTYNEVDSLRDLYILACFMNNFDKTLFGDYWEDAKNIEKGMYYQCLNDCIKLLTSYPMGIINRDEIDYHFGPNSFPGYDRITLDLNEKLINGKIYFKLRKDNNCRFSYLNDSKSYIHPFNLLTEDDIYTSFIDAPINQKDPIYKYNLNYEGVEEVS